MHSTRYCFLRFPGGLPKAVTFSYDDGAFTDVRLVETADKYGLKFTLNLTGDAVEKEKGLSIDYLKNTVLAHGHEIATHGYMHRAPQTLRPIEFIRETLDTRLILEEKLGDIIRGFAYPDLHVDRFARPETYKTVKSALTQLDIAYGRMACSSKSFELPEDWHNWQPTAHHDEPWLFEKLDEFIALDLAKTYCSGHSPKLFFIWGHSFEFEAKQNWHRLEEICSRISGKSDVWYATGIEICSYAAAFDSLLWSANGRRVFNPTLYTLWFDADGKTFSIAPGETLTI
ncbi:MAG: polysaccharide deacetylase family protein [Clostridia bacterium]|nr:polysaccharide deacetylase family protein [Clostridia bacterium]